MSGPPPFYQDRYSRHALAMALTVSCADPNAPELRRGRNTPVHAVTVYNALLGSNPLKGGNVVLIQGAGGVSIFALQVGVASGATVIVLSVRQDFFPCALTFPCYQSQNYRMTFPAISHHSWFTRIMKSPLRSP